MNEITSLTSLDSLLNAIRHNFSQVTQLLKQRRRQAKNTRYVTEDPYWHLVIGPKGSGKSQLFQAAELTMTQCIADPENICRSWVTPTCIFTDLPSELFDDGHYIECWEAIANLIKTETLFHKIDGLILTLDILSLCQSSREKHETDLHHLQCNLTSIAQHFQKPIPLFLIISHMDLLAGFTQFFTMNSTQDRKHAWGMEFQHAYHSDALLKEFHQRYDVLLDNLHKSVIKRLHHSRNKAKRRLISEFPYQMGSIRGILSNILQELLDDDILSAVIPRGLFFVSSKQDGVPINRLARTVSHQYGFKIQKVLPLKPTHKAYFIQDLLQKVIALDYSVYQNDNKRLNKRNWWFRLAYSACAAVVASTFAYYAWNLHHSLSSLTQVETALQNYELQLQSHTNSPTSIKDLLQSLAALQVAKETVHTKSELAELTARTDKVYSLALEKQFLPWLANQFKKQLEASITDKPANTYHYLKAYLMLAQPRHLNTKFLAQMAQTLPSVKQFEPQQQHVITKLINNATQNQSLNLTVDYETIGKARDRLMGIPVGYMAYLLIKSDLGEQGDIPYRFTKKGFMTVYQQRIPRLTKGVIHDNWVLSRRPDSSLNEKTVVAEVRQMYINDYNDWWNLLTYNIDPKPFQSFNNASQAFHTLANGQSPLVKMIQAIQDNTGPSEFFDAAGQVFNQKIAHNFSTYQSINIAQITSLQEQWQALANYFDQLKASGNPDELSFELARLRFIQNTKRDPISRLFTTAQSRPEPLRTWINRLAENSWYLILAHTQAYLNDKWHHDVLLPYQNKIAAHYPIDPVSKQQVSLSDFNQFFSPKGTLYQFVYEDLAPFIDMSQAEWKIKLLNNMGLKISKHTLKQLIRGKIITSMFYPDQNSDQANVTFSLQPISFEPIISNLLLNINGQKIYDYQGSNKLTAISWPNHTSQLYTQLTITNVNGITSTTTENGPWGLFKLLSQANIKQLADPQHYEVMFNLKGSAAKYSLTTNQVINPFIPGIINKFNLPRDLG